MYVVLGIASVCVSGIGVYMCATLNKEDVKNCLNTMDEKINDFIENVEIKFNKLINNFKEKKDKEDEEYKDDHQEYQYNGTVVELTEQTELLASTSSPNTSSEGEKTLSEFILLDGENSN